MRIAIVGVGAIGAWLGVRLADAGHEVGVLARGDSLAAIRRHGLRLTIGGQLRRAEVAASDCAAELGPQDLVIVALKAPALAAAAPAIAALLGPRGTLLPAMNGVPWWFTAGLEGPLAGAALEAVDPGGALARSLPPGRVLGCVVHASCTLAGPGHSSHANGERLIVGEAVGPTGTRLAEFGGMLAGAGLEIETSGFIQRDVWYKLWGNLTMNPISALTGATTDRILADDLVRKFVLSVMAEAAETGRRIGCVIAESGEARLGLAAQLGAFKTSMLQDAEAGRPLEIDALVAAPREIAARLGLATPAMDALLGLIRLYAAMRA